MDDPNTTRRPYDEAGDYLRLSFDSMLDPLTLMEALRDDEGRIVDFLYLEANRTTCEYFRLSRDAIVGQTLRTLFPNVVESGNFGMYERTVETGQVLDVRDYLYPHDLFGEDRWYDIRAWPAGGDRIGVTWQDVTERFLARRQIADLLAETEAARADAVRAEAVLRAKNEELEASLARVKTLEGFIHICMYCKKIRNDDESWDRLEKYLTEHSDAKFSHGMCPECYERQLRELD